MTGKHVGEVELSEGIFGIEPNVSVMHDVVKNHLANCRQGTQSALTRGEVSGGGAKPYRQKGTGRARQGSSRAPQYRGGGIVFGPQPRDYAKKVNRKVEKLALRRAFTDRLEENEVILVDRLADFCDAQTKEPKTKLMLQFLNAIEAGDNVLILDADIDSSVELACRNLPGVFSMNASSVNTYLMMYFKKVVITKAGLDALGARLA
jgi:large subunit ribosomal protein L4